MCSGFTGLDIKARFILLVDLLDFFFRFRVGDKKKSSESDQLTGHFQSWFFFLRAFFFFFSELFFLIQ